MSPSIEMSVACENIPKNYIFTTKKSMGDFVEVENTHTTIPICVKKSKGNNCTRILYFVKMMHAKDEMTKGESSGDNFRPHNWVDLWKLLKIRQL